MAQNDDAVIEQGVAAAEAIVIAARNYEDAETFGTALHLATRGLSRRALMYALSGVGRVLSEAVEDTVWRAEHSADCPNVEL